MMVLLPKAGQATSCTGSGALVELVIESLEVDDLLGRQIAIKLLDNVDLVVRNLFINDNGIPSEQSAQFT